MLIEAMKSAGPKMIVSIARRRGGDVVDVDQAEGVLDLRLDADPADLVAHRGLDLGEQDVERLDLVGGLHLGQHEAVEVRAGALDHLDDVLVGPLGRPVVDPDGAHPVAPVAGVQHLDDVLAGVRLRDRRHRVLDVEEHLVGVEALGLLQEPGVGAGDGVAGAAGADLAGGRHGLDCTDRVRRAGTLPARGIGLSPSVRRPGPGPGCSARPAPCRPGSPPARRPPRAAAPGPAGSRGEQRGAGHLEQQGQRHHIGLVVASRWLNTECPISCAVAVTSSSSPHCVQRVAPRSCPATRHATASTAAQVP